MKTKIMLLVWLTVCSLWAETNVFVFGNREPAILRIPTNYETIYYETNVVSGDNARGCSACATAQPVNGFHTNIYHPPHGFYPFRDLPYVPATGWWTTNITKIWKLTFEWRGKKEELVRSEVVTNITVRSKLESKWSESISLPPSPGEIERQRDYFNARYGAITNFYVAEPDIRYGGAVLGNALKGSKPITP
jgi:hypothetical protein